MLYIVVDVLLFIIVLLNKRFRHTCNVLNSSTVRTTRDVLAKQFLATLVQQSASLYFIIQLLLLSHLYHTRNISSSTVVDCLYIGSPYAIDTLPCPVCLSVTLVYYGQQVGCIKMKLGTVAGLDPGYTVLDGDPAPPKKATEPPPNFRPMSVLAKRLHGLRCHLVLRQATAQPTVLDGDPSPSPKREQQPRNFWPMSVVAKCLDRSRCHLVRRQASALATLCQMVTQPFSPKGARPSPTFRRMPVVAKQLDGSRCYLVGRQTSAQATLCLMGTYPPKKKGTQPPPLFSAHVYMSIVAKRSPISATSEHLLYNKTKERPHKDHINWV